MTFWDFRGSINIFSSSYNWNIFLDILSIIDIFNLTSPWSIILRGYKKVHLGFIMDLIKSIVCW